jgi:tripartite-type tricarboxylate transporter receptor subunit TctC
MYAQAPKDGTAIGMAGQAIAFEQIVKNPAARYDAGKLNWIGRMVPVIQFIVAWHTSPTKTIEDAMKRETVLAATSPTGVTGTAPRLLNRLAGTKFKIIHGYPGVTGTMMAMERGETEAGTATAQTLLFGRPELLATPLVSVLVQYSKERNHLFPNVPAMGEFGRTEEEKEMLQLYGSTAELGRSIMAPPGVPEARLKVLRAAFNAMMKDPKFVAEAKKSKIEIDPLDAAGVTKVVHGTVDVSPEIASAVAKAIAQ